MSNDDSYIVTEGKKTGSTREVRREADHNTYCRVVRVRTDESLLTDNWHTNEVWSHVKNNFEGHTFAMRTLEAWGATVEGDDRAYYVAGGRLWVLDLEPAAARTTTPIPASQQPIS